LSLVTLAVHETDDCEGKPAPPPPKKKEVKQQNYQSKTAKLSLEIAA
jgi:hypothetical protein